MAAAILSSRRRIAPFGMAGGDPGQPGRNFVQRANGDIELLQGTDRVERIAPGDVFVIETPGGGGFGPEHKTLSSSPESGTRPRAKS
jgi:5-oxoprolinase (ATP-hydrolysing)